MALINCSWCGTKIVKRNYNHKFCSEKCKSDNRENSRTEEALIRKAEMSAKWRVDKREHRRNYHYKRLYGLTLEEYNAILDSQKGCCKICGEPPKEYHRSLAVDHDHNTGEIFGLLCTPCNKNVIGKLRDPMIFERAAEYLRQGSGRFVPEEFKKGQKKKRRRRTPRKVKI